MTLELCKETLRDVLKRLEVLDEPSCRFVLKEVACGISHLHEKQIIHRDIKPHNVFLTADMDVKIGDFGVAVRHENSTEKIYKASGTTRFFAPESIDNNGYSFGVDVWALGVTLYTMIVGHYPFDCRCTHVLFDKIKRCEYNLSLTVPAHTRDMIKTLLTPDPNKRPGIKGVLKHDYLSSENISKDHLLEYISKKPLDNANNQKDPHESNVMPLSRNESVPKEESDENRGTGNIFQEGLRFGVNLIKGRIVRKYYFDYTRENENVPEKERKLDIEKKSIFVLEKIKGTFFSFFSHFGKKKLISSSEMGSITSSPCGGPQHFVSRWIDLNKKYGLGYQLSDSSIGVFFNDDFHLIADGTMKKFQCIDKNGVREYFEDDQCPSELSRKFKVLKYFKRKFESNLLAEEPVKGQEEIKVTGDGIPILLKWKKDDKCICFVLLNGILQINFLDDNTKVIFSLPTESVTIIDKDNKLRNYWFKRLALDGWDEFTGEKMSYVEKVIDEWITLKRKYEDDDSAVPAKKPKSNK